MKTEILLNNQTKESIENFIKMPMHALLIIGKKGSGKKYLANFISQQLLGISDINNYPYLYSIKAIENKIGIDQIRDIQNMTKLKIPSDKAVSRILIIQEANAMTEEAQNSLLKTLEEPPKNTVIIMLANDINNLLSTIRSRVQIIKILDPTYQQIIEYFSKKNYDIADIQRASNIGAHKIGQIQKILDKELTEVEKSIVDTKELLSATDFEKLATINEIYKDKEKVMSTVSSLELIARSAMKNSNNKKQIKRWHKILQNTNNANERLLKNGSPKIILTDLFYNL